MGRFLVWAIALSSWAYAQNIPNIFGADNRVPVTSNEYPWRAVGYIDGGCTATLVAKNLILTAAHCVFDDQKNLKSFNFYPNLVNANAALKSAAVHTWWGTKEPENNRGQDWAIVKLADKLGDTYGWMGTTTNAFDTTTLVGYSGDYNNGMTATAHLGCRIHEKLDNFWLHDCDGTRGSSGGPMFSMDGNKPLIIALQAAEYRKGGEKSLSVSEYSKEYANIAVPTSHFLQKLIEVIKENP